MYRKRYSDTYWINWTNELLEFLSLKGVLPQSKKEVGVEVENDIWVPVPAGCVEALKITHPLDSNLQFAFEHVNGRYKILNGSIPAQEDPVTADTITDYTTASIKIDPIDYAEDDLKDYLLVAVTGTYAGRSWVLAGNDASVGDGTVVYFANALPAALDGTTLETAKLIEPAYYALVTGNFQLDSVSSVNDEIPVDDRYEIGVVDSWLRYCAEREIDAIEADAGWYPKFLAKFSVAQAAGTGRSRGPSIGRILPGFSRRAR
jgi:hypothetical protein